MVSDRQKSVRHAQGIPDDDVPEMTVADFRRAKPASKFMPELIEAAKRARGRPRLSNVKTHVSLRLDPEIVAAFKAEGPGWQRRINMALARVIARKKHVAPTKKQGASRSRKRSDNA